MAGKPELKKEPAKSGKVQPYPYHYSTDFCEPDWRRLPGYKNVTQEEWESALWQKRNLVKNTQQLKQVFGDCISDSLLLDIQRVS